MVIEFIDFNKHNSVVNLRRFQRYNMHNWKLLRFLQIYVLLNNQFKKSRALIHNELVNILYIYLFYIIDTIAVHIFINEHKIIWRTLNCDQIPLSALRLKRDYLMKETIFEYDKPQRYKYYFARSLQTGTSLLSHRGLWPTAISNLWN